MLKHWLPLRLLERLGLPTELKPWLLDNGSLTENLRQTFGAIEVEVLAEGLATPMASEARLLELASGEKVWVRCVCLHVKGLPMIYARTVIPDWQPNNPWYQIKHLGNRPLGEVLFQIPNLERTPFELCQHPADYWPHLTTDWPQGPTFARRSIFKQQQAPLLLTEAFLPRFKV
ncbi:hypothetical protein CYQ88_05080 [Hydrogenovibrio sp. SC-1]|uniref:chorismate--pyruvate lyase family protein n=1 Tax=Hydrogenovibrio sp. SC-1 TaxID=2065820 RepID=UPI000C798E46|nr:chorismate lyase [Hydrogenovibrio sp. SC-1]PLA74686.1 hypothetical protein CYQ88_05080 [Hydrogenovibrio sp. SC-1]